MLFNITIITCNTEVCTKLKRYRCIEGFENWICMRNSLVRYNYSLSWQKIKKSIMQICAHDMDLCRVLCGSCWMVVNLDSSLSIFSTDENVSFLLSPIDKNIRQLTVCLTSILQQLRLYPINMWTFVVTVHCLDNNSMDSKARHSLDSKICNFTHDIAWTT
jgi:hypothetical protein